MEQAAKRKVRRKGKKSEWIKRPVLEGIERELACLNYVCLLELFCIYTCLLSWNSLALAFQSEVYGDLSIG